jgi:hypothetical protein
MRPRDVQEMYRRSDGSRHLFGVMKNRVLVGREIDRCQYPVVHVCLNSSPSPALQLSMPGRVRRRDHPPLGSATLVRVAGSVLA